MQLLTQSGKSGENQFRCNTHIIYIIITIKSYETIFIFSLFSHQKYPGSTRTWYLSRAAGLLAAWKHSRKHPGPSPGLPCFKKRCEKGLTWVDGLTCSSVWLFGLLFWAKRFTFSYSGSCFGLRWTHECFCFCKYCGFVWRFIVTCPSPAPRCTWHSEAKRILEHLMAKPRATQLHQSPSKVAKCCKACFVQRFAVFRMDRECMWEFGKYCSCVAV